MKVEEAEKAIAKILAELERTNEGYVEAIAVKSIDMTRLEHGRVHLVRHIEITFKPKPGSDWAA